MWICASWCRRRLCIYPWCAGTNGHTSKLPPKGWEALWKKKCKKSKDKLPENLGVISVMGVILMWAKSSAILDPLPDILTYQREVFQNDGEILSFCLITAKRITMFSNPTSAQEISVV